MRVRQIKNKEEGRIKPIAYILFSYQGTSNLMSEKETEILREYINRLTSCKVWTQTFFAVILWSSMV